MRLTVREIATIRAALRYWRAHVKQVGNPTSLSDMFAAQLPLSVKEIDRLSDRLARSRESPRLSGDRLPGQMFVPTYFGEQPSRHSDQPEFSDPQVPVLIGHADGIRLLLGTDDWNEDERPDIQIERRPNGWALFVHPNADEAAAYLYIVDDGRSFLLPEHFIENPIEIVHEIPAEVDVARER